MFCRQIRGRASPLIYPTKRYAPKIQNLHAREFVTIENIKTRIPKTVLYYVAGVSFGFGCLLYYFDVLDAPYSHCKGIILQYLARNVGIAIHKAAENGNIDEVTRYLDGGGDINKQNEIGMSPIHYACMEGHLGIVELLLSRGAKMDLKDKGGDTCLHLACYYGHKSVISLLLEKGCDYKSKDKSGETPLELLRTSKRIKTENKRAECIAVMETFIKDIIVGIAIDVSGSMKEPLASFDEESKSEGIVSVSKLREILNVISRHLQDRGAGEISSKYLGIAFGLNSTENAVYGDLLHMMHYTTKRIQISRQLLLEQYGSDLSPPRCLTLLIERLVNAGAPSVESYARKYLSPGIAKFILPFLAGPNGELLLRDIVERLPVSCKNGYADAIYGGTKNVLWLTSIFVGPAVGSWSASVDRNEHESAQEIIKYATSRVDDLCQPHLPDDIKSKPFVSTDINIVDSAVMREILDEWELLLGDNRSDQDADPTGLLNSRLYGMTPMHKALQIMFNRFNNLPQSADSAQTRILFLVSDGVPTDATPDAVREIATQLKNIGVTIVSCYLSTNPRIPAKELFYSRQDNWDDGAKLMFDISSPMKNTAPGLKVLIDQGWKLPLQGIHNLFFQGNNRENLETFVKFTREIRNSDRHGCLLDVITRVDLDLIITNHMSQFEPRRQVGGTCYAHAIAAVFFLAMKRIKFRENGHPEFADIKNYLITKYGENGANTRSVLEASGVVYRLKFREVDEIGARQAINCRRPVVARFRLYDSQWTKFSQFYARNPTGILTSNDIIRTTNDPNESNIGHAVVLIDIHPDHLTFLNSWGTTFADQGFFHVQDSNVLKMEFFDVYWTLNELTQLEKDEYHRSISTGA